MARVLVVDDDPHMTDFLAKALESWGHRVSRSGDGLQALGLIYSQSFDLAILDVVVPGISGTGLLEIIRKRSPQTVVIMISGQAELDAAIEALKKGAYDFLKKPVRLQELEKITGLALEEGRLMKRSGYVYKDSRRHDKSIARSGIIYAIVDSLMIGLTFCLAFAVQASLFGSVNRLSPVGPMEILKLSLGLAFSYAFIFVFKQSWRVDLIGSAKELVGHLWRNISYTYLLYLAIMFLTASVSFPTNRVATGLGYLLGFLGLLAGRFFIVPLFNLRFRREGKKNIIILGSGKQARQVARQLKWQPGSTHVVGYIDREHLIKNGLGPDARVIATAEDIDRLALTDDVKEIYIPSDTFTAAEISSLIDRFKGRRLKIVMLGSLDEIFHQTDAAIVNR